MLLKHKYLPLKKKDFNFAINAQTTGHCCKFCFMRFPTKGLLCEHLKFDHLAPITWANKQNQIINTKALLESPQNSTTNKQTVPTSTVLNSNSEKRPMQPGYPQVYPQVLKTSTKLEDKKRIEGLQTSLNSSNKGFALLTKMGYKPGEGLGKSKDGIIEPIGVEVKTNRSGLGAEAATKQIKRTKKAQSKKAGAIAVKI